MRCLMVYARRVSMSSCAERVAQAVKELAGLRMDVRDVQGAMERVVEGRRLEVGCREMGHARSRVVLHSSTHTQSREGRVASGGLRRERRVWRPRRTKASFRTSSAPSRRRAPRRVACRMLTQCDSPVDHGGRRACSRQLGWGPTVTESLAPAACRSRSFVRTWIACPTGCPRERKRRPRGPWRRRWQAASQLRAAAAP